MVKNRNEIMHFATVLRKLDTKICAWNSIKTADFKLLLHMNVLMEVDDVNMISSVKNCIYIKCIKELIRPFIMGLSSKLVMSMLKYRYGYQLKD